MTSQTERSGLLKMAPFQGSAESVSQAARAASLTYETYYGLREKPFSLSADPRFLFRSPAHAPAFDDILAGIRRREGLIALTGEIGTGKTTLCRAVLQHLDRRTFSTFVPDPFVSREDLLKMLLVDFGVMSIADLKAGRLRGASRTDLSYALYEFLNALEPLQAFAVLVIDEAQNLPLPLLEEIRILSDLEGGREKLLQVVLIGQPELRDHLTLPEMRQVNQRVTVRCQLEPLNAAEVSGYVAHRLNVASGGAATLAFTPDAIAAVSRISGGTPRLINLVCDRALHQGWVRGITRIDLDAVTSAIEQLGIAAPAPSAAAPVAAPIAATEPPVPEPAAAAAVEPGDGVAAFATEDAIASRRRADGMRRIAAVAALAVLALLTGAFGVASWYVGQPLSARERQIDLPTRPALAMPPAFEAATPEASPAPAPAGGVFAIQVASFESDERAARLAGELEAAGFRTRQIVFDFGPPRGRVRTVVAGGYATLEDAEADLVRIRQMPGYGDATLRRLPDSASR